MQDPFQLITKSTNSIKHKIDNWDFIKANTKYYTHGLHNYPARMIPQIAKRLLLLYSKKNDRILDPFMGSGTVILESTLNFRYSSGIDLNPLATLLTKVKVTPINPSSLKNIYNSLRKAITKISIADIVDYIPKFPNIEFWFKKYVIQDLTKILYQIEEITQKEPDIGDFLKVVFSNTVRLVSNTRNSEFKLYRMKEEKLKKFHPDVQAIFLSNLKNSIEMMRQYYTVCNQKYVPKKEELHLCRTQDMPIPSNSIDLLVTSPPYGDSRTTVAYGQFSRLSLEFLGYKNIRGLDNQLLGGNQKRKESELESPTLNEIIQLIDKKKPKRSKEIKNFFIDFNECLI
ncbi:MAG: DNA methyltransferase, partial [Candidatus Helarchaeota archaeon]